MSTRVPYMPWMTGFAVVVPVWRLVTPLTSVRREARLRPRLRSMRSVETFVETTLAETGRRLPTTFTEERSRSSGRRRRVKGLGVLRSLSRGMKPS